MVKMKKKICPACGKRSLMIQIIGNFLIRKCQRCPYENQIPLEVVK
jgi:ribosomal protein S27AE